MRRPERSSRMGRLAGALAVAACLSAAVLTWFGWRAVREWQSSQLLLSERRAQDAVDLLVTALARDMQGVQRAILSTWWEQLARNPPDDGRTLAATAFARYPYPESFFALRDDREDAPRGRDPRRAADRDADSAAPPGPLPRPRPRSLSVSTPTPMSMPMPFFNRWNRPPPWLSTAGSGGATFPVTIAHEPGVAELILRRIETDVSLGRQFSAFDLTLAGVRYQVVARLFYRDAFHERLAGLIGFTVNLDWVRQHYFTEMAREVARIGNHPPFWIVDESGRPVATPERLLEALPNDRPNDLRNGPPHGLPDGISAPAAGAVTRRFPILFFDPRLVSVDSPHDLARPRWEVRANPAADEAFLAAMRGAHQTLLIAGVAVATLVLGLFMTARAARESAKVARMRADHTAIRLVLDNLVDNAIRYAGAARWISIEARRQGDRQVVLDVRDAGVGIPPEELAQVTRRFYRGKRHRSSGSGLGLTIADRIVSDHGGALSIRSEVGAGTTVSVALPVAGEDDDEADSRR